MGLILDQDGQVASIDQLDDIAAGDPCVYSYRGPKGNAVQAERFVARVLGFTKSGRARLDAYDHVQKEWFRVTLSKDKLARINGEEYESLKRVEATALR